MSVETKKELILQDDQLLLRETVITSSPAGNISDILSKMIPRPVTVMPFIGRVKWRGADLMVHMIHSGPKVVVFAKVPTIGPKAVFKPIYNAKGLEMMAKKDSMTIEQKTDFAKSVEKYINGWRPDFGVTTVQGGDPLNTITLANVAWEEEKDGPLLFMSVFDTAPSAVDKQLTGLKGFYWAGNYLACLRDKELWGLNLVNHFDEGRICMGNTFDRKWNTGVNIQVPVVDVLQESMDSYNTTQSNSHLFRSDMPDAWTLTPDRTKLVGGNRRALKTSTLSLSFMRGITG